MSDVEFDSNGDPVGPIVEGWTPRPRPERVTLDGRTVRIVPLSLAHVAGPVRRLRE